MKYRGEHQQHHQHLYGEQGSVSSEDCLSTSMERQEEEEDEEKEEEERKGKEDMVIWTIFI